MTRGGPIGGHAPGHDTTDLGFGSVVRPASGIELASGLRLILIAVSRAFSLSADLSENHRPAFSAKPGGQFAPAARSASVVRASSALKIDSALIITA